ncbi:MAG: ROK family transcriptional regulator [Candidatus Izimaplasma sp.]|nr:ROK family transcriptional regulator [Candidatus Izimaplasma bacterium]
MTTVKRYNRSLILKALSHGVLSRKDIAKKVNLTPASVSILVAKMIEENLIIEAGTSKQKVRVGRKKSMLDLNANYKYIIGITIETHTISFALSNLKQELITYYVQKIDDKDIASILKVIQQAYESLCFENRIHHRQLLGIGIGIVGQVDSIRGISLDAYGLWSHPVHLKKELEALLNLPIVIENNVRALALVEMTHHSDTDALTFIKYGPGIGAAFVHNHTVYTGSKYNSLELGHTIVDPRGKRCKCGQQGCLETVASYTSILDTCCQENILDRESDTLLNDLVNHYKADHPRVKTIIDEAIKYFAIALINLLKILDTKDVILYGDFFKEDLFFNILIDQINSLRSEHQFVPSISNISDDRDIGAIYIAYQKLFLETGGLPALKQPNGGELWKPHNLRNNHQH